MSASAQVVPLPDLVDPEGATLELSERLRLAMQAHYRLVWRVLRRAGLEPRDADEAAQDVFWVLARRMNDVRRGSEKGFLIGTAVRIASERRRSRKRGAEVELDPELETPEARPDELVELYRARRLLDDALSCLSDEQRAVFVLIEMEQLTSGEVAQALGIPAGTVASRLRTGRQLFDEAIARLCRREQSRLARMP